MASPTEDDLRVAAELVAKWRADNGMESDIASAIAAEREKAATRCDAIAKRYSGGIFNDSSREVRASEECAASIRAGDKESKTDG